MFSVVAFYRCFHWASSTVMETTSEITRQTQQGIQCNQGDSNSDGDDDGDDGGDNDGGKTAEGAVSRRFYHRPGIILSDCHTSTHFNPQHN